MSKYAPKGIPTPASSFVRAEIAKFEKFEKTNFSSEVFRTDNGKGTGASVVIRGKSEKEKYADWLLDEVRFFKREIAIYHDQTVIPAKNSFEKSIKSGSTPGSVYTIDIHHYKQSTTKLTLYLNFFVSDAAYLPTEQDWVYIPELKGGDSVRWKAGDGGEGVVLILGTNYTLSPMSKTLPGDSSPTVIPAQSIVVRAANSTTDSSQTKVTGAIYYRRGQTPEPGNVVSVSTMHKSVLNAYRDAKKYFKKVSAYYADLQEYYQALRKKAGLGSGSGGKGGGGETSAGSPTIVDDSATPVAYNIPSVKWAYFTNSGTSETTGYPSILLNSGGSPASLGLVKNAKELWGTASQGAHKGMFQTYSYWKTNSKGAKSLKNKDPNLPDWYLGGSHQTKKYGFQFLYNPSTVQMGWGGATNSVDPGLYMSGKDATPYITPSQTSSWISFDLIINRMPDMALLNSRKPSGVLSNLEAVYGLSHSSSATAPSGEQYLTELQTIQELGTMYDIEYLLSTLVGFREFSALRGRYTADFGFLFGVPVELHLGKQMRYIGTILDFNVTHTIFSEGMIPIFTNISLTFSRRVEPFPNSKGKSNIDGNGSLLNPGDVFNSYAPWSGFESFRGKVN
jgi:hypothetical protein